jgi:hypothetical protein
MVMEPVLRTERLFDGLTADEQRRLYFFLLVADKLDPQDALAFAERIESFIGGETASAEFNPPPPCAGANDTTGDNSSSIGSDNSEAALESSKSEPPAASKIGAASHLSPNDHHSTGDAAATPKGLGRSMQVEFFKAVAQGASNAELAERFGLTKRQAHALRIGMVRRSRAGNSQNRRDYQRKTVGALIAEGRPGSEQQETQGEAEVVRFLRQTGDVVVKDGAGFMVNSILKLTLQELIGRCNARRLQRGKPAFDFPRISAPDAASKTNGAAGEQR